MPRLIWVFAGRTPTLLVLSWGSSFYPSEYWYNEFVLKWQMFVRGGNFFCLFWKRNSSCSSCIMFHVHQSILYIIHHNSLLLVSKTIILYEPRHKKTCLWGLRPGLTQTGLPSHRRVAGRFAPKPFPPLVISPPRRFPPGHFTPTGCFAPNS